MKLTVKNFGPVKEAEVEVNNLNILMGDNNGGKTYLSYLVYGAFTSEKEYPIFINPVNNVKNDFKIKIPKIFNPFSSLDVVVDGINDLKKQSYDQQKAALGKLFHTSFERAQVFGNILADFEVVNNYKFGIKGSVNNNLIFSSNVEQNDKTNIITFNLKIYNWQRFNILFLLINKSNAYFFSSERNGINLFSKSFDRHNSNLIQTIGIASEIDDDSNNLNIFDSVRVAKPVNDNIAFTRDIELKLDENAEIENEYILKIFQELIGGTFSKAPNAQITFDQEKDGNLIKVPLYLASSAARCLSDLYFYLKHLAKNNDVIFIDEPESHLTLDRQRIMAKLLVAIANAGVKVWVTTHSDFMVREVNNLIKLSADLPGKQAFLKEYEGEYKEQDCIKPDEVNIYNMEEGIVKRIEITEKGMATDSFLDIAIHKANTVSMDINYFLAQEEDEVNE